MAKIIAFAFLLAGNVEKIDFAGFGIGGWVVECEKLLGRSFGGWWGGSGRKNPCYVRFPCFVEKMFFQGLGCWGRRVLVRY